MLLKIRKPEPRSSGLRKFDPAGKADRREDIACANVEQGTRFHEVVEVVSTADECFDDLPCLDPDCRCCSSTRIVRPAGWGWRIADFGHEKRTPWERRRAVIVRAPRHRRHTNMRQVEQRHRTDEPWAALVRLLQDLLGKDQPKLVKLLQQIEPTTLWGLKEALTNRGRHG